MDQEILLVTITLNQDNSASFLEAARASRRAGFAVVAGFEHHLRLARSLKC